MNDSTAVAALPYQDPPIKTILILLSFLILLNAINYFLDHLIYCGLVGQVLVGVAFGTPGAKWLDKGTEQVIVQLGYLGLILLVYEGGLNTNFKSSKANASISALVALTGICVPIAFAFCLQSLAAATPLQAFAAGAALCSTSLGTTFSILSSSGLTNTRIGTILTSAAMMDDVVGLVLVQVISSLGSGHSSLHAITVVRPIIVSVGLALSVLLACVYVVKPFSSFIDGASSSAVMRAIRKQPDEATLSAHIALLFGMVATASYAGTSNLFAAYLAGASISWYYSEVVQLDDVDKEKHIELSQSMAMGSGQKITPGNSDVAHCETQNTPPDGVDRETRVNIPGSSNTQPNKESDVQLGETNRTHGSPRGTSIYMIYIQQPVARILKPFFFAGATRSISSRLKR